MTVRGMRITREHNLLQPHGTARLADYKMTPNKFEILKVKAKKENEHLKDKYLKKKQHPSPEKSTASDPPGSASMIVHRSGEHIQSPQIQGSLPQAIVAPIDGTTVGREAPIAVVDESHHEVEPAQTMPGASRDLSINSAMHTPPRPTLNTSQSVEVGSTENDIFVPEGTNTAADQTHPEVKASQDGLSALGKDKSSKHTAKSKSTKLSRN